MTKHLRALRVVAGISIVVFASMAVTPLNASAQVGHDASDDHHKAPLHFSHPLFSESPSPDTKIRLDYLYANLARRVHENTFQVEGEYAFSRNTRSSSFRSPRLALRSTAMREKFIVSALYHF